MAPKLQRLRGVRQRHWGSWVSEIRHPISKTRVWLGTYQTREEAICAYDAAAWILCGPKAKTNYPYSPLTYTSSTILPPLLRRKLHRCCLESVKIMAQQSNKLSAPQEDHSAGKVLQEEENSSSQGGGEEEEEEEEEEENSSSQGGGEEEEEEEEEENSSSQDGGDEEEEEESAPISPPQQCKDLQQWEDLGLFLHQLTDHERVALFLDELHEFNHLEWSLAVPYDPLQPQSLHSTCDDTCASCVDDYLLDESLFAF